MKNIKKKGNLDDLRLRFQEEFLNCVRTLHLRINDFINNKLKTDELEKVISCEKKCDRIKEQFIMELFKNKRALPFLVEDRYQIITLLDVIANKSEDIARYLEIYPFEITKDITEGLKTLNDLYLQSSEKIIECTSLMETDFKSAHKITFEIEALRRDAHDLKFILIGLLFKHEDKPLYVSITWKIITKLYSIIAWIERMSDYLEGLILKYPSK